MGIGFIGGILNNLLWVVVGLVMPWAWDRSRRHRQLRLAGAVFPTAGEGSAKPVIYLRASLDRIVYGSNPPILRGYTHSGDMLAAMRIIEYFHDLPVQIEFDYFPEISSRMKNVVLLGASSRSDVSREIAADLYKWGIRVRGTNEHAHFADASGRKYHCEHIKIGGDMVVSKDAGVIFRRMTDNGTIVLMCGGIHSFGSQAATEVALTKDFQRKIRKKKLKQFIQFVTVDVITSGERAGLGMLRHTIRWKDLSLLDLDGRS